MYCQFPSKNSDIIGCKVGNERPVASHTRCSASRSHLRHQLPHIRQHSMNRIRKNRQKIVIPWANKRAQIHRAMPTDTFNTMFSHPQWTKRYWCKQTHTHAHTLARYSIEWLQWPYHSGSVRRSSIGLPETDSPLNGSIVLTALIHSQCQSIVFCQCFIYVGLVSVSFDYFGPLRNPITRPMPPSFSSSSSSFIWSVV